MPLPRTAPFQAVSPGCGDGTARAGAGRCPVAAPAASFRRRSRSGAAELSLAAAAASAPAAQPQIPGLGQSTSPHSDASITSEVWSELNQGEGAPVVALIREQHDEMRERMDRLELGLEAMRSQMSSMLETMRYG